MNVSPASLYAWKRKYPEIEAAIERGRAPLDLDVVHALYETAIGGIRTVRVPVKVRHVIEKTGGGRKIEERIEYAEKQIYVPGNPIAQRTWLSNRKPEQWARQQSVELSVKGEEAGVMAEIRARMNGDHLIRQPEGLTPSPQGEGYADAVNGVPAANAPALLREAEAPAAPGGHPKDAPRLVAPAGRGSGVTAIGDDSGDA